MVDLLFQVNVTRFFNYFSGRHQGNRPSGCVNKCWQRWKDDEWHIANALVHVYRQAKNSVRL